MASHFDCIGIPVKDRASFDKIVQEFARKGEAERFPSGYSFVRWQDSSGAGLAIHMLDNAVQCVTPFFRGRTHLRARPTQWISDGGCRYCDILMLENLDENQEMQYPLAIQVDSIEGVRPSLKLGSAIEFQVAGFAEAIEAWVSRDDYYGSQSHQKFKLGAEFFIPTGTFSLSKQGRPISARASIHGTVLSVHSLVNSETGVGFRHLTLRSYGGNYDIVTTSQSLARTPEPGWIVRADCWMVGSPVVVN